MLFIPYLTKNGVWEELLLEARVPGVANDQRSENRSDTSSGSRDTHGGGSGSDELGGGVNVLASSRGGQESLKELLGI